MIYYFVFFNTPATFVIEHTEKQIFSWDTAKAVEMAKDIHERHGARPYGFQFTTRSRGDSDLDSKVADRSGTYYLGGVVRTQAEVVADNKPDEEILRSNMRANEIEKVVVNTNSWKVTMPLGLKDTVLDFDGFPT